MKDKIYVQDNSVTSKFKMGRNSFIINCWTTLYFKERLATPLAHHYCARQVAAIAHLSTFFQLDMFFSPLPASLTSH